MLFTDKLSLCSDFESAITYAGIIRKAAKESAINIWPQKYVAESPKIKLKNIKILGSSFVVFLTSRKYKNNTEASTIPYISLKLTKDCLVKRVINEAK